MMFQSFAGGPGRRSSGKSIPRGRVAADGCNSADGRHQHDGEEQEGEDFPSAGGAGGLCWCCRSLTSENSVCARRPDSSEVNALCCRDQRWCGCVVAAQRVMTSRRKFGGRIYSTPVIGRRQSTPKIFARSLVNTFDLDQFATVSLTPNTLRVDRDEAGFISADGFGALCLRIVAVRGSRYAV